MFEKPKMDYLHDYLASRILLESFFNLQTKKPSIFWVCGQKRLQRFNDECRSRPQNLVRPLMRKDENDLLVSQDKKKRENFFKNEEQISYLVYQN